MDLDELAGALRGAGARFAFLHGSRVKGTATERSDWDVAAWWGLGKESPGSWTVRVPDGVDLIVLDDASLELAGRVAMWGEILFDDDPPARVRWQATTRKIYLDEEPRRLDWQRVFLERYSTHG